MSNLERLKKQFNESKKIKDIAVCLKPDFSIVANPIIKLLLMFYFKKKTVNFYMNSEKTEMFVEESKGKFDWLLNFLCISTTAVWNNRKYKFHTGFYVAAHTIYNYLINNKMLNSSLKISGYSRGAATAGCLGIKIREKTTCNVTVVGMEQPSFIFLPDKKIKEKYSDFIFYRHGKSIVSFLPFWMTHLGEELFCKSAKSYKRVKDRLSSIFMDHDLYYLESK